VSILAQLSGLMVAAITKELTILELCSVLPFLLLILAILPLMVIRAGKLL
jgi:hypothetical protein